MNTKNSRMTPTEATREQLIDAVESVLSMHDADGVRWVGFTRADRQERYCTGCLKAAPCPTITTINEALEPADV